MSQRDYREKALERYGSDCAACGSEEDVIHHRDGDNTNHDVKNLVPLCAACHQRVHAGDAEYVELVNDLNIHPRSREKTILQVSDELADELHDRKKRGDSYEDVIWRLIEAADGVDDE